MYIYTPYIAINTCYILALLSYTSYTELIVHMMFKQLAV
jgi:hypothetical protein